MFNRNLLMISRSFQSVLNGNNVRYLNISRSISILTNKNYTASILNRTYIIKYDKNQLNLNRIMGLNYSTDDTQYVIQTVTYEEVKDLPNYPEKTLIDVREPEELKETGIIPTAINIPLGEIVTALSMNNSQFKTKYNGIKPDLDDEIIFHCKAGIRSEKAVIAALQLGYTNSKNFRGSWIEWAEREGLPQ